MQNKKYLWPLGWLFILTSLQAHSSPINSAAKARTNKQQIHLSKNSKIALSVGGIIVMAGVGAFVIDKQLGQHEASQTGLAPLDENKNPHQFPKAITTIAQKINKKEIKKIVILTGAGISTNAGIPDFRSEEGFYNNPPAIVNKKIKAYNQKHGTSFSAKDMLYNLNVFKNDPSIFWSAVPYCKFFDSKAPTPTHYFFKLLEEKGLLSLYCTQNCDGLEKYTGLSAEKMVFFHGGDDKDHLHCATCNKEFEKEQYNLSFEKGNVPYCPESNCGGALKPKIVFFGESVEYKAKIDKLLKDCDLLIVIGTSFRVSPFNALTKIPKNAIRLLINNEKVGVWKDEEEKKLKKNDFFLQGDCDEIIHQIVSALKWEKEFKALMKKKTA
ncbi:MAG: Sir2 family NAD-dependent protein deacetylase [Bacteroidota bacterium]